MCQLYEHIFHYQGIESILNLELDIELRVYECHLVFGIAIIVQSWSE